MSWNEAKEQLEAVAKKLMEAGEIKPSYSAQFNAILNRVRQLADKEGALHE